MHLSVTLPTHNPRDLREQQVNRESTKGQAAYQTRTLPYTFCISSSDMHLAPDPPHLLSELQ